MELKKQNELGNTLGKIKGMVPAEQLQEFVIANIYLYLFENSDNKKNGFLKIAYEINKSFDENAFLNFREELQSLDNDQIYGLIRYAIKNADAKFDESSSDELCELVLRLFGDLYGGPIVYDACCGRGNFLFNSIDYSLRKRFHFKDLFASDINYQRVQVLNMALSAVCELKGIRHNPIVNVINTMTDDIHYPVTHAYVFPPLSLRLMMRENTIRSKLYDDITFSGRNTPEWIFVDNVLSQFRQNEKIIAAISPRALFSTADKAYRDRLLSDGRIEGIIELPQGAVSCTGTKLILLSLNNKKNEAVKVLDASSFTKKHKYKTTMDVERVYDAFMASTCNKYPKEVLIESRSLLPSTLSIGEIQIKNGVSLSEVATVFSGSQYTSRNFEENFFPKATGYRILTSSDIENGVVDWEKLQSIRYNETKFDKFAVKKGDVVITSKSSKVKTIVVDIEPKEKILVTGGMIIVRPDLEKLDATYLKMFFDSKKGQASLKQIQKGATIITINAKDLATIQVPLADMQEQKEKAKVYDQKIAAIRSYKKEIEKLEESLNDIFDA